MAAARMLAAALQNDENGSTMLAPAAGVKRALGQPAALGPAKVLLQPSSGSSGSKQALAPAALGPRRALGDITNARASAGSSKAAGKPPAAATSQQPAGQRLGGGDEDVVIERYQGLPEKELRLLQSKQEDQEVAQQLSWMRTVPGPRLFVQADDSDDECSSPQFEALSPGCTSPSTAGSSPCCGPFTQRRPVQSPGALLFILPDIDF